MRKYKNIWEQNIPKQCAAVKMKRLESIDPPHHCVPFTLKLTCQGHSPARLCTPPTTRRNRVNTWRCLFPSIVLLPHVKESVEKEIKRYYPNTLSFSVSNKILEESNFALVKLIYFSGDLYLRFFFNLAGI